MTTLGAVSGCGSGAAAGSTDVGSTT